MPSNCASAPATLQGHREDYFEPSYHHARKCLLSLTSQIAGIHPILIDSRSLTERGPGDETLATDFIVFGARRPRQALVVSSGTHGVEGFAGSAIQLAFLARRLPGLRLASDTAVIIAHAHNPYGFAWLRRVNEHNVDINRNYLDHFDTDQASAGYVALHDILNPADLDPERESARWAALQQYAAENGLAQTQQAISEGQYRYPYGMQFGGHARQPCVEHMLALIREYLGLAREVLWIDIHTGLGDSGACELISSMPPDSQAFQLASKVWPAAVSTETGNSVSSSLTGTMDHGLIRHLDPDCRVAVVAAEFGTHPLERVIRAMRADNWLHRHPPADLAGDPAARAIKAELLEAFRPDDPAWRAKVQELGAEVIEQAISAMPGLS